MTDRPSVLFVSSCEVAPDEIIRLILRDCEPLERIKINEDIDAYPYHIDNKYYMADINLCSLKRKIISDDRFAATVQGTVIYFDSASGDCLRTVDGWLPFLNEYQPDVKILVCKTCPEEANEGCSKRLVQEWCIGKGFELVELEPLEEENDSDDDFPETTGVSRIIQALNAHVWPNLVMKNSNSVKPRSDSSRIDQELSTLAGQLHLEESLEELLENDDNFSELFSQLPELKARVSALQGTDRVAAAVQIVEAFWKAMDNGRGDDDDDDILNL